MKDLIKKILREDFDWAVDVPSYDDMKIDWEEHVIPYLTGKQPTYDEDGDIKDYDEWDEISPNEQEEYAPLAKHYFVRELNDIDFENGKFIMRVGYWDEFTGMFEDCDYSGYICRYAAEQVLGEEMDWEPYYNVVHDWMNQVWGSINDESYKLIVAHIRKWMIGDTLEIDGEEFELTEELLTSWLGEKEILGHMIDNEVGSGFEDLKSEMRWAYDNGYNTAARDEYWNSTHEAIKGVVGESEWESYEGKDREGNPMTRHQLKFDVTDIFMDSIKEYFDGYCDLEYDHECEFEYGSYLDNLIFMMNEEIYGEPLNPRVSEWPDDDKVKEYFNEDMLSRI